MTIVAWHRVMAQREVTTEVRAVGTSSDIIHTDMRRPMVQQHGVPIAWHSRDIATSQRSRDTHATTSRGGDAEMDLSRASHDRGGGVRAGGRLSPKPPRLACCCCCPSSAASPLPAPAPGALGALGRRGRRLSAGSGSCRFPGMLPSTGCSRSSTDLRGRNVGHEYVVA